RCCPRALWSGNRLLRFLLFSFFFSSRRRHTRFSRDWSSVVCSSDLLISASGEDERTFFTIAHLRRWQKSKNSLFRRDAKTSTREIGRASCRERMEKGHDGGSVKKKKCKEPDTQQK